MCVSTGSTTAAATTGPASGPMPDLVDAGDVPDTDAPEQALEMRSGGRDGPRPPATRAHARCHAPGRTSAPSAAQALRSSQRVDAVVPRESDAPARAG